MPARPRLVLSTVSLLVAPVVSGCGGGSSTSPSTITPPTFERFIATGSYAGDYWPTAEWRTCAPEGVGMDSAALYRAYEYAAQGTMVTEGLVVVRRGYIVGEAYFLGYGPATRFAAYSVSKSLLSAVVGVAFSRGDLPGLDRPVHPLFPAWSQPGTDPRKQAVTFRHLLTMQSGLQFTDTVNGSIAGTDVDRILASTDAVAYMVNQPSTADPGTLWNYSSGDSVLLSGAIQAATGRSAFDYGREAIFDRIGMATLTWQSDAAGHTYGGWGAGATVRDFARFGYLYLKGGAWNGERLVPESWVRQAGVAASPQVPYYGYHWWLAPVFGGVAPSDTLAAQGMYEQKIYVIPSRDLVVVRVGTDRAGSAWRDTEFLARVLASVR